MSAGADQTESGNRSASAFVLQDWAVNGSLYARLLLISFRIGSLRQATDGRLPRLALAVAYRVSELLFGRILGQAQLDPRAAVGSGLRLPHGGNGIVLNASAVLGRDVVLYQQVTVGVDPFAKGTYRSGRIGDRVVIGAGAKVIGDVTIGDDAVIGTNAVVVGDVPACATAVGVPARVIERDSPLAVNPATGL